MNLTVSDRQVSHSSTSRLRVIETDPQMDTRWTEFVLSHPEGSVYHHPAWLQALSKEYQQKTLCLACESEDGRLLATLPMMYTRGLPFNIGGPLTGRRLSSLPRTPLAGPLSSDDRATAAILRAAVARVREQSHVQLQIKLGGAELRGLVDGLFCLPWRNSYILSLPTTADGPFRISNGQDRARIKWAVSKAAKSGVIVRPAETELELREWYRLYLNTMRRNSIPPRPYRLFSGLWETLVPQGMMQLLVAEHRQGSESRIVAGSIFFLFGQTVSYAFNGSCAEDLSLRPNDAIQWQAINDACANGYRKFDFGEVPDQNHELAKFKSKWGAKPTRMYRCYSAPPKEAKAGGDYPKSNTTSLSESLWRRLPIKATEWIGDRMYSYL
jgi:hypothetical protein